LTEVAEAELYPQRGGLCGDAFDDQAGVAAAGARVGDLNDDFRPVRFRQFLKGDDWSGF
jgi:hypothetical protein